MYSIQKICHFYLKRLPAALQNRFGVSMVVDLWAMRYICKCLFSNCDNNLISEVTKLLLDSTIFHFFKRSL